MCRVINNNTFFHGMILVLNSQVCKYYQKVFKYQYQYLGI